MYDIYKEVGKQSDQDLVFESRENWELDFITSERLDKMSEEEYFQGLMLKVARMTWCKLEENTKFALFMRPENKENILKKYI